MTILKVFFFTVFFKFLKLVLVYDIRSSDLAVVLLPVRFTMLRIVYLIGDLQLTVPFGALAND